MKNIEASDLNVLATKLWGDVELFSIADSERLLQACDIHDVAVLGIEGFILNEGKRIPDMNCIVDISSGGYFGVEGFPEISRNIAREFIATLSSEEVFLEFVLVKS